VKALSSSTSIAKGRKEGRNEGTKELRKKIKNMDQFGL
jgi:hypothetical protein